MSWPELIEPLRRVVELLVAGRYDELARLTSQTRLSAEEIGEAVRQYGRTLTTPPPGAYHRLDVIEIQSGQKPCWSVRIPLWTKEEGQSDLSVEVTITQEAGGLDVVLDDIHVL